MWSTLPYADCDLVLPQFPHLLVEVEGREGSCLWEVEKKPMSGISRSSLTKTPVKPAGLHGDQGRMRPGLVLSRSYRPEGKEKTREESQERAREWR
jgi:hypothetical protein